MNAFPSLAPAMRRAGALCIALAALGAAQAATTVTQVYEWRLADGTRALSNVAPRDVKDYKVHRVETPTLTAQERAAIEQRLAGYRDWIFANRSRPYCCECFAAAARDRLAWALHARDLGREPLPGERRGSASGGSRLAPMYFERQDLLDDAVARARTAASGADCVY